ncbi:MAG: ABC transporter ATP-binding protein, partial [Muribaculaceae bacterium]|nr:ABC transporter ATP-binding protein [Muribaculaceae bacterium]
MTRNLTTGYSKGSDKTVVTYNLDASLLSGEMTCLLGPNGAGKTTLLKTLAAMIPPLNGEILIEGKNLLEYSELERAKKIGIVLTDKISAPNLTVEQLVALGRNPYTGFFGKLSIYDKEIIDESIEMIGINDLRKRKVIS